MWPFGPSRRERALQADIDAMTRTLEMRLARIADLEREDAELGELVEVLQERVRVLEAERREADKMRDLACAERDRVKARAERFPITHTLMVGRQAAIIGLSCAVDRELVLQLEQDARAVRARYAAEADELRSKIERIDEILHPDEDGD